MDISSVESIEGLPNSYTAVVPITDQPEHTSSQLGEVGVVSIIVGDEEMNPADLPGEVTIRPDINEPVHEWLNADPGLAGLIRSYDDALNLYRSVGHSLSSSMVSGPGVWHINEIHPVDHETSELTVGRLGLPEFRMRMPQAATEELIAGDRVLGPERLYTGGGIFGWGRVRVDFEPDDEQPSPIPIWVPLQRLHRPRHNGCEAEYQLQTGVDEDVEVNLTVLGIGGGSVTIGGTFGTDMSTEGECIETVVPATLQLQFGKTLVNGTEVSHGMRATITDLTPRAKKTRAIPPENDACERPRSAVAHLPQTDSFDQTEVPEGTEYWDSITLRREVVGKMTVGLELGSQVPFKFGMDYVRTTSQEITVRTLLARGAHYLGYAPSRDGGLELEWQLEICWTTQQN